MSWDEEKMIFFGFDKLCLPIYHQKIISALNYPSSYTTSMSERREIKLIAVGDPSKQ